MKDTDLKFFRKFFKEYVGKFYKWNTKENEKYNKNIKLKEIHTYKVYNNIIKIGKFLNLSKEHKNIAKTIALFHDIGRFEQLKRYGTYNDNNSINHGLLGVQILESENVLEKLNNTEQEIIKKAILFHNAKNLQCDLNNNELFFCKIIRDADKLDIYRVIYEYLMENKETRDRTVIGEVNEDTEEYSKDVVKSIFENKIFDNNNVKTINDKKLSMLSWVFDINFLATLYYIKKRKYIDKFMYFLPQNEEVKKIHEHIRNYVDEKLKNLKYKTEYKI